MSKIVFILLMTVLAGFLLRVTTRGGKSKKYERKPTTPWAALNDDVDPTV